LASGASTVALSQGSAGFGPASLLALAFGAGLLAGLGVVKLALRQARA